MQGYPKIYILILTWNRRDDIMRCLESLQAVKYPNLKTVVIDNGSEDSTVADIRSAYPGLEIIENKKNLGYSAGNNRGIEYAMRNGADFILILNNDVVLTRDVVSDLYAVISSDERIAVVGSKVLTYTDPSITWTTYLKITYSHCLVKVYGQKVPDKQSNNVVKDVDAVAGCSYMWRCSALKKIGLIDEEFFGYHEDVDWCYRAKKAGYRVVYVGTTYILHVGGSSVDQTKKQFLPVLYFLGRNGVLFARKHANLWQWMKFLPLLILSWGAHSAFELLRFSKKGIEGQIRFAIGIKDGFSGVRAWPPEDARQ